MIRNQREDVLESLSHSSLINLEGALPTAKIVP
jgi:hypothetical protein